MKVERTNISASEFIDVNLSGTKFDDVNLSGARLHNVNLSGAQFEDIALVRATFRNINFSHVSIDEACYEGMTINGILVTELLRVYQDRSGAR